MAFFHRNGNIVNKANNRIKRLGKEQLQYLIRELGKDLEQGEILLQSLPIGIILLNKDFHLQLMNRAAKRCPLLFSQQSNNIYNPNYPIWNCLRNEDLANWLETELQGGGVPQPREFQHFDLNNDLHVTRIEISSQVHNGSIEGWIILVTDVSELRQQERKVQQLDILASLSTVTAGIAHEIKNPLAAISLHIQLMQRLLRKNEFQSNHEAAQHKQLFEYCDIVQEEIEHLNTFVTDFLLTVRPLELELLPQNIEQVLQTCLELLEPELKDKNIQLFLDLAEDVPQVALDTVMFKRLLLNLLLNAIQAIEEKKEQLQASIQSLYIGNVTLRSYYNKDKIHLEIIDNGCGMSDETKKKILEPFFTTRAKGSGLGMTMVLRILQTHNGDLQIQTTEGEGSIMRIILPTFHGEQRLLTHNEIDFAILNKT